MMHRLGPIHISSGSAWIMGTVNHEFSGMEALLTHIGCKVEETHPEAHESSGCRVTHPMFSVVFPEGSKIIKHPKDESSGRYTASGRKRKGAPKARPLAWSLNKRKGQILVPGDESDFIVTWYCSTRFSPELFDRGVHEVEKDYAPEPG